MSDFFNSFFYSHFYDSKIYRFRNNFFKLNFFRQAMWFAHVVFYILDKQKIFWLRKFALRLNVNRIIYVWRDSKILTEIIQEYFQRQFMQLDNSLCNSFVSEFSIYYKCILDWLRGIVCLWYSFYERTFIRTTECFRFFGRFLHSKQILI